MFQGAYQSFNFSPIPSPTHLQAEKVRGTGARYLLTPSGQQALQIVVETSIEDADRYVLFLSYINSIRAESLNLAASEVEELQRVRGLPTLPTPPRTHSRATSFLAIPQH
jgi:hypothetical protein